MEIRNLKTFVRAAELQSFSKAAAEMGYVQSTVTMQIRQLEEDLGYPLFDRIGKRVSLTARGGELLAYAYEILHLVDKAENLQRRRNEICGVLRIGVTESLIMGVLMDLIPLFKAKYVNLDLSIKSGHTTELLQALKQNRLDVVYLSKSLNTDPDLCCYYARREELIFLSGPEHSLAHRKKISMQELMQHHFLVTEREGMCYGRLCEAVARYGVTLKDPVEVDNIHVITQLTRRGVGLAFLPEFSVTKELEEGQLVKLDADIPPQTYYSQILCHKSRWLSPFLEDFIGMIKEARPEQA